MEDSRMLPINSDDSDIVKSAKRFANMSVYDAERGVLYASYMSGVIEVKNILSKYAKENNLDKNESVKKLIKQLNIK
ncbi:hypothetical protein C341T2LP_00079 [Bacteroides phage C3_41T2LP]|nr:hypothetical protein C341T2LP_00079 [Bacteroides phage C3_41T2LP]